MSAICGECGARTIKLRDGTLVIRHEAGCAIGSADGRVIDRAVTVVAALKRSQPSQAFLNEQLRALRQNWPALYLALMHLRGEVEARQRVIESTADREANAPKAAPLPQQEQVIYCPLENGKCIALPGQPCAGHALSDLSDTPVEGGQPGPQGKFINPSANTTIPFAGAGLPITKRPPARCPSCGSMSPELPAVIRDSGDGRMVAHCDDPFHQRQAEPEVSMHEKAQPCPTCGSLSPFIRGEAPWPRDGGTRELCAHPFHNITLGSRDHREPPPQDGYHQTARVGDHVQPFLWFPRHKLYRLPDDPEFHEAETLQEAAEAVCRLIGERLRTAVARSFWREQD